MKTIVMTVVVTDDQDVESLTDAMMDLPDSMCLCGGDKTKQCSLVAASVTTRSHRDDQYVDFDLVIKDDDDE